MTRKKTSALATAFKGRWRIVEMDLWDQADIDLVGPGFIDLKGGHGEMRFIAVQVWLDLRYGARDGSAAAEFSFEGMDEDDQCSGRGWVMLGSAGRLVGHIFFHNGDDSGFVGERD